MRSRPLSGLKQLFFLALYASDIAMFALAVVLASTLIGLNLNNVFLVRFFMFTLLIILVNFSAYGLYRDKRNLFDDNDFMGIVYALLITSLIIILFILMFNPGNYTLFLTFILSMIFTGIFISMSRLLLGKVVYLFRKLGYDRRRVLFFGENTVDLIKKVKEHKYLGYEIIKTTNNVEVLKKYLNTVQVVFIHMEKINEEILDLIIRNKNISWKIIPPVLNLVIDPVTFDEFRDYPIINVPDSASKSKYLIVKRFIDLVASGLALIVLSPLFLFITIVMKLTMPGMIFFNQERLGKDLKPFTLYKFRTMIVGAESQKSKLKSEVKGLFKMKDDPRITKFGKFLRRTNIDELPQLINIFKGDMSLVGPRPHLRIELENFKAWRRERFSVKPGLTGLWQVNGRHELNFDKAVLYDIYYTTHMSFFTDLAIILKTIPSMIMSRGRF